VLEVRASQYRTNERCRSKLEGKAAAGVEASIGMDMK
jgi:hypothetical protein